MEARKFNSEGYKFVTKLQLLPKKEAREEKAFGSSTHLQVTDWTDKVVDSPIFERVLNHDLSEYKIQLSHKGNTYGFPDKEYIGFNKFINSLSQSPLFSSTASSEYLQEKSLLWMVETFQTGRATTDLIPYIENELDKDVKERIYYFPVINLHIDEPFKLGNTEFTYFTKSYFDRYWEICREYRHTSKEDFDKLFRKYQGRVMAACVKKAEPKKAEQFAFEDASLAMDVIKLYSPTLSFPSRSCKIDLEKRLNLNFSSGHLSCPTSNKYDLSISFSANNDPFYFSMGNVNGGYRNGLNIFSEFLIKKRGNDFENLLLQTITLTANALSNSDLHLRTSQLVMIMESVFLLENEDYKVESKCKRRISVLLFHTNSKLKNQLITLMTSMYEIRHKMVHKACRIFINQTQLRDFQYIIIDVILRLIQISKHYPKREDLIKELDNPI